MAASARGGARYHQAVRRLAVLALVSLLVVATVAEPALARRAPSKAEASAIKAAVAAFAARPGAPAPGSAVRKMYVSTVSPRYALAKLRVAESPRLATAILKRTSGRYRVVSYGVAGFPFAGVPRAVLNDLLGATICDCG